MANKRYIFTFPTNMITEPVIFNLGRDFEIETNIRRADIREDAGWVILELKGTEEEIDKVTTPRGCTIEGLNEMEHQGLSSSLIQGIVSSFKKINEIAQD